MEQAKELSARQGKGSLAARSRRLIPRLGGIRVADVYLVYGGGAVEEIAYGIENAMKPYYRPHVLKSLAEKPNPVDCNLHFLSRPAYFNAEGIPHLHPSNRTIVNWLHGGLDSINPAMVAAAKTLQKHWQTVDRLIVPNSITRAQVLECGVDESRITVIPNGVDTHLFKPPPDSSMKQLVRRQEGIPEEAFVIGSFQRDGNDDGIPKLEKGPDTLLETIKAIHSRHPIFLLLTGSGRRYVMERLAQMGIPFIHRWVEPYSNMVQMYYALDLFLITSREEGGPAGLRESMATGVPVVSTRMGLAADIIQHGVNGMLAEAGDFGSLADAALQLVEKPGLGLAISEKALQTIQPLDYRYIAERYRREAYAGLFR